MKLQKIKEALSKIKTELAVKENEYSNVLAEVQEKFGIKTIEEVHELIEKKQIERDGLAKKLNILSKEADILLESMPV